MDTHPAHNKRQRTETTHPAAAVVEQQQQQQQQQQQTTVAAKEAVFPDHDVSCCWIQQGTLPSKLKQLLTMTEMRRLLPAEREKVRMFGRLIDMPRYSQNYGRSYQYSGVVHHAKSVPEVLKPVLTWINQDLVAPEATGEEDGSSKLYDALLVNWYCDKTQYIGEHADDEKELVLGAPIISVSLGQERVLRIRPPKPRAEHVIEGSRKRKQPSHRPMRDIPLKDGTYLVMGGRFQEHFTHQVPKGSVAAGVMGLRVNLTARQYK